PFGAREPITSFFNLVLTYNRGISFGLFNGGAGVSAVIFSVAAAAIVLVLIYWLSRAESPLLAVAIGLIIGGAVGNVIDRLRHGAVIDFLDFHIGSLHWPAFNLADSAICVGVAAMLLEGLVLRREAH
ncbi:MAG: signal peptidase II, partial [Stellaceae bacterium]